MQVPILAARPGWHTDELLRALRAAGHDGVVLPYEGLVARAGCRPGLRSRTTDLDGAPAVLARIIPSGSLEQLIWRVDALHRLEDRGHIAGEWGVTENGRRAKYYRITTAGRDHLRTEGARLVDHLDAIVSILSAKTSKSRG